MGGLVTAIEVKRGDEDTTSVLPPPDPARRLRLLMRPSGGFTPAAPIYGIALQELPAGGYGSLPDPPSDTARIGPTIVLNKGEPSSIMLVNRMMEPTSMHWHGLEVESFYDGVPAFSGIKPELAPAIAPNDSFDVRITPTRTGTFIYHSHMDEMRQQRAGLVGALLVVEKGKY